MLSKVAVGAVVVLMVVGGVTGVAADPSVSPVAQQGGDGGSPSGGDGRGTPGGDGGGTPMGGDGPGSGPGPGPNVSVQHRGPGDASIMIRNAGASRTVRIRFERAVEHPETGLRVREMTVTAGNPEYRMAVRTRTRTSAGVARFPGAPPFGYLNVTHSVPNANVTNASFTFTLNRTRLRERNVTAEAVRLHRYRATNRTWDPLRTRVTERNRTHVTYRADSPGLSEFAVAPAAVSTATTTPTATPEPTTPPSTATPTPSSTPPAGTDGSAPGFGPLATLLALVGLGFLRRRR